MRHRESRNILEQSLIARGLRISDFIHYIEVENMHTIIGLLKKDCGISFLYKIAVENELKSGILKEISLDDFKMQHDFDIIWEKHSIYTDKYTRILLKISVLRTGNCFPIIQIRIDYRQNAWNNGKHKKYPYILKR